MLAITINSVDVGVYVLICTNLIIPCNIMASLRALGFPISLKTVTPPKGSYISTSVGGVQYFVFNDHKEVCFVTNVFPESMNSN